MAMSTPRTTAQRQMTNLLLALLLPAPSAKDLPTSGRSRTLFKSPPQPTPPRMCHGSHFPAPSDQQAVPRTTTPPILLRVLGRLLLYVFHLPFLLFCLLIILFYRTIHLPSSSIRRSYLRVFTPKASTSQLRRRRKPAKKLS